MWCPSCGFEHREGFTRCLKCEVDLVAEPPDMEPSIDTGPLTGRPIEEELEMMGPAVVGSFVTMEEAQMALRALADAGIAGEVSTRDEQFPMTISRHEPAYSVTVEAMRASRAREILSAGGLLPVTVARFRREEDARWAIAILESKGLKPRLVQIVLDEMPAEFRGDMDPYSVEVPDEVEGAALEYLEAAGLRSCEACGAQIQGGDQTCRACGEAVGV